ncbi:MAG: aromatic ring-hydroxylating dioxygenase subunit alpha, partial [Gammaproteobacteria bacterium]|nr:aromatic ring-hydroxylating dioxygenase subunit alpha [Gammaproteobacteria bacterium]
MSEAYKPLDPETMPRSPGITYQELLDQDSRPVPDVLRLQSPKDMGLQRYSV